MTNRIENLIKKAYSKHIWDEQPIFSFTSDIDWASEAVLKQYFEIINPLNLKPTLFVTHPSDQIETNYRKGLVERGLHPNFLQGSSHGNSFKEIAETCIQFAPEAFGFRSHRVFDVTDITHLMHNDYGFKYVSHPVTILQPSIKPILHESGLINFPVFFEDGTHLYNQLDLNFKKYKEFLWVPGIKIISFHPMNFVFNSPSMAFMRNIKDAMSREEYNDINEETIERYKNKQIGIRDTVLEIIEFTKSNNSIILSMNDLYHTFMESSV